jgi:hypothetical protein
MRRIFGGECISLNARNANSKFNTGASKKRKQTIGAVAIQSGWKIFEAGLRVGRGVHQQEADDEAPGGIDER